MEDKIANIVSSYLNLSENLKKELGLIRHKVLKYESDILCKLPKPIKPIVSPKFTKKCIWYPFFYHIGEYSVDGRTIL